MNGNNSNLINITAHCDVLFENLGLAMPSRSANLTVDVQCLNPSRYQSIYSCMENNTNVDIIITDLPGKAAWNISFSLNYDNCSPNINFFKTAETTQGTSKHRLNYFKNF